MSSLPVRPPSPVGNASAMIEIDSSATTGFLQLPDYLSGSKMTPRQRFGLPPSERLITSTKCYGFSYGIPQWAKLYLYQQHLCYRTLMSPGPLKQEIVRPWSDLDSVINSGALLQGITLIWKDKSKSSLEFTSKEDRDRIHDACQRLLERAKRPPSPSPLEAPEEEAEAEMEQEPSAYLSLPRLKKPSSDAATIAGEQEFIVSRAPVKHVTILTIGSRGDVQPFISFCYALRKRGYKTRIASFAEYRGWVESHGIEFREVAGDPTTVMSLCVDNGMFTVKFIKEGINQLNWIKELFETAHHATKDTDLILATQSCMIGANLAQVHRVPFMHVFTMPWHATSKFPHPFMVPEPGSEKGETYNEYSWKLIEGGMGIGLAPAVNNWRRNRGLAPTFVGGPIEYQLLPCLYNFSNLLLPKPSDWPLHVHNTGFWFLDNPDLTWKPPQDLLDFLAKDEWGPVVYIGFGSIVVQDPEGMSRAIVEAVKKAGVRAIVSEGWSARGKDKKDGKNAPELGEKKKEDDKVEDPKDTKEVVIVESSDQVSIETHITRRVEPNVEIETTESLTSPSVVLTVADTVPDTPNSKAMSMEMDVSDAESFQSAISDIEVQIPEDVIEEATRDAPPLPSGQEPLPPPRTISLEKFEQISSPTSTTSLTTKRPVPAPPLQAPSLVATVLPLTDPMTDLELYAKIWDELMYYSSCISAIRNGEKKLPLKPVGSIVPSGVDAMGKPTNTEGPLRQEFYKICEEEYTSDGMYEKLYQLLTKHGQEMLKQRENLQPVSEKDMKKQLERQKKEANQALKRQKVEEKKRMEQEKKEKKRLEKEEKKRKDLEKKLEKELEKKKIQEPLPPLEWPEQIYKVKQIPHDWLFSRIAAVCHHGGAGSTAAGLRAGCPTIIKPFFGDQFFWADCVVEQGLGVRLDELDSDLLAQALITVTTDMEMKGRAERVGEALNVENGQDKAVDIMESEISYARDLIDDLLVSAQEKKRVRMQKRKELEKRMALNRETSREEARIQRVAKLQGKEEADLARMELESRVEEERAILAKNAASQRLIEEEFDGMTFDDSSEEEGFFRRYDFKPPVKTNLEPQNFKELASDVANLTGQIAARAAVIGTSLAATGVVLAGKTMKGAFDVTVGMFKGKKKEGKGGSEDTE